MSKIDYNNNQVVVAQLGDVNKWNENFHILTASTAVLSVELPRKSAVSNECAVPSAATTAGMGGGGLRRYP